MLTCKKQCKHVSVLLAESVAGLNIKSDGIYVDGTFGQGGHARIILSQLNKRGKLIVIDRDMLAIDLAKVISLKDRRLIIIHGEFSKLVKYVTELDLLGKINGILLDFGMSSLQLENPYRGFSFMHDGPLDMRMDIQHGFSATEWLSKASVKDISLVLKNFGEEKFANRIAKAIVNQRKLNPVNSTYKLASLIMKSIPYFSKDKHPATRSFQAIRIYINDELEEIKQVLEGSLVVLAPGGRLSIISFNSLEDRLVKNFVYKHSNGPCIPSWVSLTEDQIKSRYSHYYQLRAMERVFPSKREVENNSRSRSAILRFMEKL